MKRNLKKKIGSVWDDKTPVHSPIVLSPAELAQLLDKLHGADNLKQFLSQRDIPQYAV